MAGEYVCLCKGCEVGAHPREARKIFGMVTVKLAILIVSLTSHEQKEAISPTGAVEQMRQIRRPPDQCSL